MSDMDFVRNCVFIDEAGFNLQTQRNYGRSRNGTSAKCIVPTAKDMTITILGAQYHIQGATRYILEETASDIGIKEEKSE
jgi:hypothetical protein